MTWVLPDDVELPDLNATPTGSAGEKVTSGEGWWDTPVDGEAGEANPPADDRPAVRFTSSKPLFKNKNDRPTLLYFREPELAERDKDNGKVNVNPLFVVDEKLQLLSQGAADFIMLDKDTYAGWWQHFEIADGPTIIILSPQGLISYRKEKVSVKDMIKFINDMPTFVSAETAKVEKIYGEAEKKIEKNQSAAAVRSLLQVNDLLQVNAGYSEFEVTQKAMSKLTDILVATRDEAATIATTATAENKKEVLDKLYDLREIVKKTMVEKFITEKMREIEGKL